MSTITGGSRFSYPFITIGTQIWSTKNLDVSTYRNGDPIPQVTDPDEWTDLTTGAWCYYNNDPANGAIYGKLYNWYAIIDPRGLAPQGGWSIPSNGQWSTLVTYLGNTTVAGGTMKEAGTSHWNSPNTGATNSSGFTALPGGYRTDTGIFFGINTFADFFSSTLSQHTYIFYNSATAFIETDNTLNFGLSVRLIKN